MTEEELFLEIQLNLNDTIRLMNEYRDIINGKILKIPKNKRNYENQKYTDLMAIDIKYRNEIMEINRMLNR